MSRTVYSHPDGFTLAFKDNALTAIDDDGKAVFLPISPTVMKDHTLHQSGPGDGPGPVSYMAVHNDWGMARHLPTLVDAKKFLKQIGGESEI